MSSKNVIDLRRARRASHHNVRSARRSHRVVASRRAPSLRSRRRKLRIAFAAAFVVVCALAAYGVSWISYLPQYSIAVINVDGAHDISPVRIQQFVDTKLYTGAYSFLSPQNIFTYDRKGIEKALAIFFPRVKSVTINRSSLLANAIEVHVVEREPYAEWCAESLDCYVMDESGYIFAEATSSQASTTPKMYVFHGGLSKSASSTDQIIGRTFAPAHSSGIIAFLKLLSEADFTPLGATVENDEDFSVPVDEGFSIKASYGEDATALIKNLNLILSSDPLQNNRGKIEYIDLRFGDKVYYKLKEGI
jgi:cell division septal protein FtsQ